uniref:Uncharacterized protein n=1 Tax=Thermodesulfovibrio aggregans TaxID=86166 RepID=A0A7C4AK11_9BACT
MIFFDPDDKQERAEAYRLFAYLFMNIPDIELVEEFERFAGIQIKDTYEEICEDFIYLFTEGNLPNCESFYRQSDVQHFYWTAGVAIEEEFDLPPDHISMELLFMSYLIEQNLRNLEIDFLSRLCEWIPLFCEELYETANTDFYKEVATFVKDFVLSDCGAGW